MAPTSSKSQVRVVLRVRPFLPSEIDSNPTTLNSNPTTLTPCITVRERDHQLAGHEVTVHLKDQYTSRQEWYQLDSLFDQENSVSQIFQSEVRAVIPGILRGLNATVFAYGATGSGKTYTMQGTEEEPGLIPLAVSTILSLCEGTQSSVEVSYYEVYMDRCYDLLQPKTKEIVALDDKHGRVQLKGLSWVPVNSMEEFAQVFSTGIQRRKVAHTGLNDVSSRSHGVLSIAVADGDVKGKLNLIDLAGNEDNRRTGNEGIQLQESGKINQSLFSLSNVIYALNNNEARIPYRASKLTRILQDSLGGTSRALMIACLNPTSYQEAVHTVSLAARSRQIVNYVGTTSEKETPRLKVDMEAKLRAWLESKGKTKSIQRINGPFSPILGKTPNSNCHKKEGSVYSSVKAKATGCGVSERKGRKLFDSGNPIVASTEKRCLHEEEEEFTGVKHDNSEIFFPPSSHVQMFPSLNGCDDDKVESSAPDLNSWTADLPGSLLSKKNLHSSVMESVGSPQFSDKIQEWPNSLRNALSPLPNNITRMSHLLSDIPANAGGTPSTNKENYSPAKQSVGSPPLGDQLQELQKSLRKIIPTICKDNEADEDLLSNKICLVLLDPKTPKVPKVVISNDSDERMDDTPLDKFNTSSSNLKESLVQDYLAFLNAASKEELMQLKGIGQRRAEYILQLREQTPKPLKSLSDLEKIGLSTKQVHDMFRRAARGIFA